MATTIFYAQVGIGTTTPDPSSVLDLTSTTAGFLLPRLTTAERDLIAAPVEGLMIYNNNNKCFEFWNATDWISACDGSVVTTPPPPVTALSCGSATFSPVTFTAGVSYMGTTTVPYTGGNGAIYGAGTGIASTGGVTGLTATLQAGTLIGSGNLTYDVTGTPSGNGQASFAISFGGQSCTMYISNCGAFVSPGVFKAFLCHNLGADTSLDPHVPVVGLQGAYIQWGRRGPTGGDSRVTWQTADNTANFAAAPTSGNANEGIIAGWSTTDAANDSWGTAAGDNFKNPTNDPCPTGYRVPTSAEWTNVNSNNTVSRTGLPWSDGATSYGAALHYGPNATTKTLTLSAAGFRTIITNNGTLVDRGNAGYYWSSSENGTNAFNLYLNTFTVLPALPINRTYGFSLRCIAE